MTATSRISPAVIASRAAEYAMCVRLHYRMQPDEGSPLIVGMLQQLEASLSRQGLALHVYRTHGSARQENATSLAAHPASDPRPPRASCCDQFITFPGGIGSTERCAAYRAISHALDHWLVPEWADDLPPLTDSQIDELYERELAAQRRPA
jgi:hypothetical protein